MQPRENDEITLTDGWWSAAPEGWSDVADATYDAWKATQVSRITLDADAAKAAMEFGFGARATYLRDTRWEKVVERLQADWSASGREAEYPWEYVHNAVKAGWTAAPVAVKPRKRKVEAEVAEVAELTAPDADLAAEAPDEGTSSAEDADRNVPGGRPDVPYMVSTPTSGLQAAPRVPGGRPDRT